MLDLQGKSNMKYAVLEKKVSLMREELHVREAQLHNVVHTDALLQQESSKSLSGKSIEREKRFFQFEEGNCI